MSNITLRQLKTLLAIRNRGKISAAADALGLTSPAVTLQLQQLEQEFGLQLFSRTRGGAVPTDAGVAVIDCARRIFNELDMLDQRLEALKGGEAGRIRIGAVSTGKYFAPRLIAAFNAEHPGIEVSLVTANRARIIAMLEAHEIDIALMGRPPSHFPVRSMYFGDHPLVFISRPDHPLAKRRDISFAELAHEKFIVRESGSGTRSSFEIIMGELPNGAVPATTEMDSNETIKQAVMAGLGLAFISGHTIEHEIQSNSLCILDVAGTPIRRRWFTVRDAQRDPSPAILQLEDFIRSSGLKLLPILPKTYSERSFFS